MASVCQGSHHRCVIKYSCLQNLPQVFLELLTHSLPCSHHSVLITRVAKGLQRVFFSLFNNSKWTACISLQMKIRLHVFMQSFLDTAGLQNQAHCWRMAVISSISQLEEAPSSAERAEFSNCLQFRLASPSLSCVKDNR